MDEQPKRSFFSFREKKLKGLIIVLGIVMTLAFVTVISPEIAMLMVFSSIFISVAYFIFGRKKKKELGFLEAAKIVQAIYRKHEDLKKVELPINEVSPLGWESGDNYILQFMDNLGNIIETVEFDPVKKVCTARSLKPWEEIDAKRQQDKLLSKALTEKVLQQVESKALEKAGFGVTEV